MRKLKFRGKVGRIPRQQQPDGIRLTYYAELRRMLDYAHALVKVRLIPKLEDLLDRAADQLGTREDAARPPGRRVNTILDGISSTFYQRFPHQKMEDLAAKVAAATQKKQKLALTRQIEESMTVQLGDFATKGLTARIGAFTADNVGLIKTVPQTYFDQVEKLVLQGMRAGTRHEEIAKQIEERFDVAKSSAKLIARDQVGKFYGELNMVRQQQLGLTRYIWRTSNDERVREAHLEREGELCDWEEGPGDPSDPGDGEHPGQGINCRCEAEPYLEDVVD